MDLCVPLKYLLLMPYFQEAKYFEFTVQIFTPQELLGGKINFAIRANCAPPPSIISVFALVLNPSDYDDPM